MTGESFGIVRVWDLATGRELLKLGGGIQAIKRLGFLPDGEMLVSVSADGIRLWKAGAASENENKTKLPGGKLP